MRMNLQKVSSGIAVCLLIAVCLMCTLSACDFFDSGNDAKSAELSSADAALQTEAWIGVQCAEAVQGALLLDRETLEPVAELNEGEGLILCQKCDGRYLCRCGALLGYISCEDVVLCGELTEIDCSYDEPAELSGEAREWVDAIFQKYGAQNGCAVVIQNGELAYFSPYGKISPDGGVCDINTKFRVASVSKVLVAMSAMAMDEQGIISIEDDINSVWGDVEFHNPYYPDMQITFENLLTHTSTINNMSVQGCGREFLVTRLAADSAWFMKIAGTKEAWSYSNGGYGLLGASLEMACADTLVNFTQDYFFNALGADASFRGTNISDSRLISPCYSCTQVEMSVEEILNVKSSDRPGDNFNYSGSLVISGVDLARLACILANDGYYNGVYYMSSQTVENMETVRYELDGFDQCIGIRYCEELFDGRDIYYHNGVSYGVVSLFSYDPETRDGVIVIANGSLGQGQDSHRNSAICVEIAEYLYSNLNSLG